MFNKIVKYSFKALLLIPVVVVLHLNLSLHYTPSFVKTINEDELAQLNFLENELHHKAAGEQMQAIFPEGFFFVNVLYGLAYTDFVEKSGISPQSELGKKAEKEMTWAIGEINSEAGVVNFLDKLPLENGAFYKGWQSYLLGRKLQVSATKDAALIQQFQSNCEAISRTISATNKPYLESYKGAAWPADNMLCLASLALHDRIFTPKYQVVIANWMDRIKAHLDEKTGLIPHSFSLIYDKGIETRGSSQSLMLSFLPKIDPVFAQKQYEIYKNQFVQEKLAYLPFANTKWALRVVAILILVPLFGMSVVLLRLWAFGLLLKMGILNCQKVLETALKPSLFQRILATKKNIYSDNCP
jgi:hypothetical protein